jgi:hypothetical protein
MLTASQKKYQSEYRKKEEVKKIHVHLPLKRCTPKMNYWYTYCCCQDAEKISSMTEIEDIIKAEKERDIKYKIFRTKEDLIDAVCSCENKAKCLLFQNPLK